MKRIVSLLTFLWVLTPCCAQSTYDSSQASRDPAAVDALERALYLSGGSAAWSSIHGARVKGTLTAKLAGKSGESTVINSIVWLDDWSTGHTRYNKITTNAQGVAHTLKHGDSQTFSLRNQKHSLPASRFDDASILLTHLPAEALIKVLSDKQYSIAFHMNSSDSEHNEISVSKVRGNVEQIWYLLKKTGQVHAVRFTLPDVINESHKAWETAIYKNYRLVEGLVTVPENVVVIRPNSLPVLFDFQSLELNPNIVASDFGSGESQ